MTLLDRVTVKCGACGKTSTQTVIHSTNQLWPGDLDGRPGEMMRCRLDRAQAARGDRPDPPAGDTRLEGLCSS